MASSDNLVNGGDGNLWITEAITCFGILVAFYILVFSTREQQKILNSPEYGKPGDASFGQALKEGYTKVLQYNA